MLDWYCHYLEIDPDYQKAFSVRFALVKKAYEYKLLKKRFSVLENKDGASINSYTVNPDDVVEYDGVKYIDAEGYLAKGINFYWKEDGGMEKAGVIKDIAYNKDVNGVECPYAVKVKYVGEDAYWKDGEGFLTSAKINGGEAAYYIALLDSKRPLLKEEIDYEGDLEWESLSYYNVAQGVKVYMGYTNAKKYIFTIKSYNTNKDTMIVKYPDGNVETKSYRAMVNNNLYIKK